MVAELHDLPICFDCKNRIETNPIFAALCGHGDCPSAVFHGLCLMEFREKQARAETEGVHIVGFLVSRHAPGCPNGD